MRYRFGHARAARAAADNIIVELTLPDGTIGWGEAVPRQYVTGETPASVTSALARVAARTPAWLRDHQDLAALARVLSAVDLPTELGGAPAAAAALELALLDAHARREGRPLLDAIALSPFAQLLSAAPPSHVRQTLTIGDDVDAALERAGAIAGPLDVKLKVGFGVDEDVQRAARLRERFGAAVDLRADANAAWDRAQADATLEALAPYALACVEEPLKDHDLAGCAALRRRGVRVMLDESLCTLADAERAVVASAADAFNLRLSKCGGLFATLRLVERAERAGIAWQLGCMVGESGILSSLGRGFVARVRGAQYLESTVPGKSLEADLTDAMLDHVAGTRDTPVPMGAGFGANLRPDVLARYTVTQAAHEL
jgi:muconate cycloisomerase